MDNNKFNNMIFLSLGLILFVTLMDFLIYPQSFYIYAISTSVVASIVYYLFRRDISESIAIASFFIINYYFGLADFLFYIIQGSIPATMPHLNTHIIIGPVSKFIGYADVTMISLTFSTLLGLFLSFTIAKILKDKF